MTADTTTTPPIPESAPHSADFDKGIACLRSVMARHPIVPTTYPNFDEEPPAQAILSALKDMAVSHDNIALASTYLGVSLNPSTMTRIGSEGRTPTARVLAGLCMVWAATYLMREGYELSYALVKDEACTLFLITARKEWDRLVVWG